MLNLCRINAFYLEPTQLGEAEVEVEVLRLGKGTQFASARLYQEGNLNGALDSAQQAVSLAETAFGSGSLKAISSLMLLAQIHTELDQLEEANQIYQLTLETSVASFGEAATETLLVLDNYGEFLNSIDVISETRLNAVDRVAVTIF